jgi:hypothetical protein
MHSNGLYYQCCGSVFTLNSIGLYGAYMHETAGNQVRSPRWIKWGERGRLERGWGEEAIVGRWARNLQINNIRLCFSTWPWNERKGLERKGFVDEIYSRVVRASDGQCRSRNCPGFDPSIIRHSGNWGRQMKQCWMSYKCLEWRD